jgi:hypothetical protein
MSVFSLSYKSQVVSEPSSTIIVYADWLSRCFSDDSWIMEDAFMAPIRVLKPKNLALEGSKRHESAALMALSYKPSGDSLSSQPSKSSQNAGIIRRRSDASSVPLRPDGVFKGLSFSLFGWTDSRLETSLSYQLTSNGASVVKLVDPDQYACICADGSRPTTNIDRILSSRWINDCLAHEELLDPASKPAYMPSRTQLPILLTSKVCLYITENDPTKFDEIADLAKLMGLRYISRSESRVPVSAVTHFIFYGVDSIERRRDLVPIARKNGKFIVSYEWLKDSYLAGQLSEAARYNIAEALDAPALSDRN